MRVQCKNKEFVTSLCNLKEKKPLKKLNYFIKTQLLQDFYLILLPKRNITQNHRVRSYGLQGNFRAEAKERPAHEKTDDGRTVTTDKRRGEQAEHLEV